MQAFAHHEFGEAPRLRRFAGASGRIAAKALLGAAIGAAIGLLFLFLLSLIDSPHPLHCPPYEIDEEFLGNGVTFAASRWDDSAWSRVDRWVLSYFPAALAVLGGLWPVLIGPILRRRFGNHRSCN